MAFLTLNGIPVQVAPGSAVRRAVHLGEYARSFSGASRSTLRGKAKVDCVARTTQLTSAEAPAYRALINGEGHVWSFEDSGFTSSRGLAQASEDGDFTSGDQGGKYGFGLWIAGADGSGPSYLTWSLGSEYAATWTFMYWRLEGATWHHYARTSTGTTWKNGVSGATNPGVVSLTGGTLKAEAAGGPDELVDELVALPYVVPATWPALVHAAGAPFGALPLLAVGGLWLPDVSSARGKTGDEQVVNAWEGAGTVGFTIDFELMGS